MEVSVRERLGGRRAISWQALILGDLLIVVLATALAALTSGERRPIDAAADVLAITAATALVAAGYAGIIHLTVFRDRARHPVPVAVAVAFHVSIGVIFLVGFAVGAQVLGVPPLGSSAFFIIGVLLGGLLVCIPTSLVLDLSDRYRADRARLMVVLADLERLRVSEWSLRRALRRLTSHVDDVTVKVEAEERLDALDLSEDTVLSSEEWWAASAAHHQGGLPNGPTGPPSLTPLIEEQLERRFPVVRWRGSLGAALDHLTGFPAVSAIGSAFAIWVLLAPIAPSITLLLIGLTTSIGIYGWLRVAGRRAGEKATPEPMMVLGRLGPIVGWTIVMVIAWSELTWALDGASQEDVVVAAAIAVAGVLLACLGSGWASGVMHARADQVSALHRAIRRRRDESSAVFASLTAIVTRIADDPTMTGSAAVAACAAGLQRAQRESDPVHARRILEWTESVVAAPSAQASMSLESRIAQLVHPWTALADITVYCDDSDIDPDLFDDIVAVLDEAVRNACRHGDARTIHVTVVQDSSRARVEVIDDGSGLQGGAGGLGLDRYEALGSGGFEVTPRGTEPGTRVVVWLKQPQLLSGE